MGAASTEAATSETAAAPPVSPTGIVVIDSIEGEEEVSSMAEMDLSLAMIILVIITVGKTSKVIRTEGWGGLIHHHILAENIPTIDMTGEMEEGGGVEEGRGALLPERMTIVGMGRVFMAVTDGTTPPVEGMGENEISTNAMLGNHCHPHHIYHSEEVEGHEETYLTGRRIKVVQSLAGATLVRFHDLVATLPRQTGQGRAPPLDHHVTKVPLDQSHVATPLHHLVVLRIESVVAAAALFITVMTKNEG